MESVGSAEKEATEVLHSLLSVERIVKQDLELVPEHHQVVVVTCANPPHNMSEPSDTLATLQTVQDGEIQWHSPVTVHSSLFSNIADGSGQFTETNQVIWQGHALQLEAGQGLLPGRQEPAGYLSAECGGVLVIDEEPQDIAKKRKKQCKVSKPLVDESLSVEENAQQVRDRFGKGCECQEENCFKGLSAEYVYRHRLNIAELTKAEHDMYLMGVTMAVLTNPEETVRRKERRRLRAQYVFLGRRVCLDAFLYLENCTHYQLKRIRKHVMTHGVAPRVHGNHGKKPHNTFPLDIYRHATSFLRHYINKSAPTSSQGPPTTQVPGISPAAKGKPRPSLRTAPLYLSSEITRKTIHNAYREYCDHFEPSLKVMGYSTFRHFMKEQFPHVKFCKVEVGVNKPQQNGSCTNPASMKLEVVAAQKVGEERNLQDQTTIITSAGEMQRLTAIPVVLSQGTDTDGLMDPQQPTTYIVTPVSQLIHTPSSMADSDSYTSYQLTPAGPEYSHQQITVAAVSGCSQPTVSYGFTTL